jgi:hypothetical protein
MKRTEQDLEKKRADDAKLAKAWRAWHAEELKEARHGPHGVIVAELMAVLDQLTPSSATRCSLVSSARIGTPSATTCV